MFFLWGILIASPVVAVPLLGVICSVQTLLTPLAAGDNRSFRWNRPLFTLAAVTTVIALAVVSAYSSRLLCRGSCSAESALSDVEVIPEEIEKQ